MNKTKSNYLILLLLALIFLTPGISAYFFFRYPHYLGSMTTNRGLLLTTPHLLASLKSQSKWSLILWNPEGCDHLCQQQLDKLARVRLALGRRLYEVDQWLVTNHDPFIKSPDLRQLLQDQDIHLLILSPQQQAHVPLFNKQAGIFIANPQHYLVLTFLPIAQSEDIFHDLKQLLTTAEKKND